MSAKKTSQTLAKMSMLLAIGLPWLFRESTFNKIGPEYILAHIENWCIQTFTDQEPRPINPPNYHRASKTYREPPNSSHAPR